MSSIILLAIAMSTDAISIGLGLGKINKKRTLSVFYLTCLILSIVAIVLGEYIDVSEWISAVALILMGCAIIIKSKSEKTTFDLQKKELDLRETIALSFSMSTDIVFLIVSEGFTKLEAVIFAISVAIFQFLFLLLGMSIREIIQKIPNIPNIWNELGGFILLTIGLYQFF